MDLKDKIQNLQPANEICHSSSVTHGYENKVLQTAARVAVFKLRAEKSFLDKKQESMKRWMDKHREESKQTMAMVCNKAKSIIEEMAKAKKRELQDMVIQLEKAHEEELKQLRLQTRIATIRDFLQNNRRYLDDEKVSRIIGSNIAGLTLERNDSEVNARPPQIPGIHCSESFGDESSEASHSPNYTPISKRSKIDEKVEKEPFGHREMQLYQKQTDQQRTSNHNWESLLGTLVNLDQQTWNHNGEGFLGNQVHFQQQRTTNCNVEGHHSRVPIDQQVSRKDACTSTTERAKENGSRRSKETQQFTCTSCGRKSHDMLMCSGCRDGFYCNEDCQMRDWNDHVTKCLANDETGPRDEVSSQ